ncbi:DUF4157 domain-containing protein [Actinomycetes bacterium KLBMP 9797]
MRPGRARRDSEHPQLPDTVERAEAGIGPVLSPPAAMLLRMQETAGNGQVARIMRAGGESSAWPGPLQSSLENAFQLPLGGVPLTLDANLAGGNAAAAADGVGVRISPQWFDPSTTSGRHLLAHEVAHLALQTRGATSERTADDLAGRFVRGQTRLAEPSARALSPAPMRYKTAVEAAKDAIRLACQGPGTDEAEIFEALRKLTPAQMAELATDSDLLKLLASELSGSDLGTVSALLAQGRIDTMTRPQVAEVLANPASQSFGAVAAAEARDTLLEHQAAVAATGTGTIQGNRNASPLPVGVTSADCTTYVLDVLRSAFAAKGQAAVWTRVMATARAGGGQLKGTDVLKALQSEASWEGVFWAADPRNPADNSPEHPAAAKKVREGGTYYGVKVDSSKSALNYRRTASGATPDFTGLEMLRRLQFGVLAARGGLHMALIVNGSVYEIHWDKPASDPNAIEATPLESFDWLSGAIVAPKDDLERATLTP